MKKLLIILVLVAFLVANASAAWVTTHVTDAQGKSLVGATVTIKPDSRRVLLQTTYTGFNGKSFPVLLNANESYTVTVSKKGFVQKSESRIVPSDIGRFAPFTSAMQLESEAPQPTPQPAAPTFGGRRNCHYEMSAFAFRGGPRSIRVCD